MTDISLNTVCNQRLRQMLFTVPPQRFTPISPYPQYTQAQLDMRRKAEVLSYGASKSNTKTNNYTKAEKYALFVSGVNQSSSFTTLIKPTSNTQSIIGNIFFGTIDASITIFGQDIIKATAKTCPNLDMTLTPTSSSDVPGPITYLYRDLTVPLYNYATNERSYSSEPVTTTDMWALDLLQNNYCSNNISTTIFSVGILNPIDKNSYNYTYRTPVALTYSALITNTSTSGPINVPNIMLSITKPTVLVYYSGQQVQYITPVCTFFNNNILFDISFDVTGQQGTQETYVSITGYIGAMTISNLNLFTSPGFVYDVQLNCSLNITNNNSLTDKYTISNEQYGVICNYTGNNIVTNNCKIDFSPITTLTYFSFSGI
jgi:hypothetical protein